VFITGLEDDLLPHSRSVKGEDESEDLDALEEERRLFHVGMTRARENLFLTYCRRRYQHGEEKHMQPSRFLDELPDDCVETGVTRNEPAQASEPDFADEMDRVVEARRRAKERRAEEKKQSVPDDAELEPGQRVDHPKFGEGTVLDISESGEMHRLRIDFDTEGEMTLMVPRGDLESSSLGAASG
ncbi:MAG: 3'-5' exonuclease, partial [Planctomycetota bacterium]